MTNATITKVLNKVNETIELSKTDDFYISTLGFHRLSALPKRVRNNFNTSYLLKISMDTAKCNEYQVNFLGNLTDVEFKNWLKNA